jgi:hypothetical protein
VPAEVADVIATVACHRMADPGAPLVIDADTWSEVAGQLARQRLTGLAALATADGQLLLGPDDLADLAQRDRPVQVQALRAERLTLELCADLDAVGVPHRVLKGPAYAHGLYPGPATRPFIDVDLLVPGDALDDVVARCERAGAERLVPQLRPGFDRQFAKSVTLRHPSGTEIDLHRTLALGPLTHLIRVEDLWVDPASVEVLPGRPIPVLPPGTAFLHACIHAASGGPARWLTLRDVVETARDADLEHCTTLARRWTLTAVAVRAVAAARDREIPIPAELQRWSSGLDPSATEHRVADSYAPERRSARGLARSGLRYVRGPLRKIAYARALVVPVSANRRARHRSVPDQVRRALGRP